MSKWLMLFWMVLTYPIYTCFISLNTRCKWSKKYFDMHDYHKSRGGDGTPSHFYEYSCHNCNKKFSI